ncbi:MAG: CHASE2 domain-containing protein [Scytonema sp. CRU_2_7]|nr:CHASE2 domain-containing protein [Scytonema sp. CRU_2_7]
MNSSLWQQGWDILFFAGHSFTQEKGKICINNTDSLTIDKLKYGLKKAIERGLKLAIFNSCDGLGLARDLADLHIPQIIVMRELVPDQVAQTFLKHFLKAFSSGQSLYTSVRDAREQLQGEEKNFPCATWLPVICQNPAEVSPTWEELRDGVRRDSQVAIPVNIPSIEEIPEKDRVHPQPRGIWHRLQVVFCTSVVVTGLVMGVRSQGMLEALELPAYDQMMRMRGDEGQDKRLLIVTIDDADIKYQQEQKWNRRWSLSDEALDLLLKKLDKYEPRAIGLDVARLAGVDSDQADLAERLRKSDHFYASCYVRVPGDKHSGTPPPPEVPVERQGFSNVIADSDDVVRRHLVFMDTFPTSLCTAPGALSTELAIRYLKDEGIEPEFTSEKSLRLKQVVFKSLQVPDGGYQNPFGGSQIMLNYRTYNGSPLDFADTVTLTDVLSNKIKPETVKDRVVLIGVIASTTTSDRSRTPYQEEIPGSNSSCPNGKPDYKVQLWVSDPNISIAPLG